MRGQLKVVNLLTCLIYVACVTCEDATRKHFSKVINLFKASGQYVVSWDLYSHLFKGEAVMIRLYRWNKSIWQSLSGDMFQDVPRVEQVDLSPPACRRVLGGADEIHSHRQFSKFEVQFQQSS